MNDPSDTPTSDSCLRFARRGPYSVGVTTERVADARDASRILPVDLWYPAEPAGQAGTPAEHPFGQPHRAHCDARPLPGPFPLIAFSHGNSGLRRQSTFLTTHLASWGFVVVAPDHVGNTFPELLHVTDEDLRIRMHKAARLARPLDLGAAIAVAERTTARWPRVDASRIGVLGHSFGGWTAFKMPRIEARVQAVCGLAPATELFVGRSAFEPDEFPLAGNPSSLIIAGLDDTLVQLEPSIWPLHDRLAEPRALVAVRGADHFHFCDGIGLLHGMHEKNERGGRTQRPLPAAKLLDETRMHRLLCGMVAAFFDTNLRGDPSQRISALDAAALARLDPALQRLDRAPGRRSSAA